MQRATTLLRVKSFDEEKRTFKGIATTPSPDKVGDVLEPFGGEFDLPLPLLLHHDHELPVGQVIDAVVTSEGIEVTVELPVIKEEGKVRERVEEAWHSVKYALIKGFSVGFGAKMEDIEQIRETGGLHFKKWQWRELSLVTVPCNNESYITELKSVTASSNVALDDEFAELRVENVDKTSELDENLPVVDNETKASGNGSIKLVGDSTESEVKNSIKLISKGAITLC